MIALLGACDSANPFQVITDYAGVTPDVDPDNPLDANGIPTSLSRNLQAISDTLGTGGTAGTL